MIDPEPIRERFSRLSPHLDERGRRRLVDEDPSLLPDLLALVEPHERGCGSSSSSSGTMA